MMAMVAAACLISLPGPVIEPFGPEGAYGGHWGVDVAMAEDAPVVAPLDGVVTFSGVVAGVRSVTIRQGRFRVSLSYLGGVEVRAGDVVRRGQAVARAGRPHGVPGLHVGLRLDTTYVDPRRYSRCSERGVLRLLPPMLPAPASKD